MSRALRPGVWHAATGTGIIGIMPTEPTHLRSLACAIMVAAMVALLTGCASSPPREQHNLCAIFEQHPDWYDDARAAQERWGTPIHILMAFIRFESNFRQKAKPPREYVLGIIPWGRQSSAYGYAQIKDPVWGEYKEARSGFLRSRTDMTDVLDFIGWYNHHSAQRLGLSKWNAKHLYLAYHEGRSGYRSKRWRNKRGLMRTAERVDKRAREYGAQLRRCEHRFRCDGMLEFWPLCR